MLARTAPLPFDGDDWLFEVKWDGYRCLAYLTAEGTYLDSRNGKPLLHQFPGLLSVRDALRADQALLDGEIVALKDGRVDFSYLRAGPSRALFVAFDLLWLDGKSLLDVPLEKRKEVLKGAMEWGESALLSETVEREGKALFSWARERDLEGVMAKRKGSLYYPGERSGDWLKIKNLHEGTFWVVGYMPSPGRVLGSLVVARRAAGGYEIVGRVSSGLNRDYEKALIDALQPLEGSRPPKGLGNLPPRPELRRIRWVAPYYGVEVAYTEMTADGHLRHPVFKEVTTPDAR
jgi:DNA ligase-1